MTTAGFRTCRLAAWAAGVCAFALSPGSDAKEIDAAQAAATQSSVSFAPPIWASEESLAEGTRLREWMGGYGLGTVSAMLEYQGDLFAAVNYWPNRSESVRALLRWSSDGANSNAWEVIGVLDQAAMAMIKYDGALVVAGSFTTINGEPFHRIAKWQDGTWTSLGDGFTGSAVEERDPYVVGLTIHDGALITGGNFTHADGKPASSLARWNADDHSWEALASDVQGFIGSLASWRGNLVVAGNTLRCIDGVQVNRIGVWNGSNWESVGGGANRWVDSLAVYRGDLIVSGRFSRVGDVPAARVARWDGSAWHAMGAGMGGGAYESPRLAQRYGSDQSGRVRRLLVHNDTLYAGGIFGLYDDPEVLFLAKWNGSEWESTGRTARQYVRSMTIHDGVLTAGGVFLLRSADPVYYFERVPSAPASEDAILASSPDQAFPTSETLIEAHSANSVRPPKRQIVRAVANGLAVEQSVTLPHEAHAAITTDDEASVVDIPAPMAQSEGGAATLPEFEAIPVTGPAPFIYTWLMDLNNAGQAVGYASAAAPALDPARAYLWNADDAPDPGIDLGDFGQGWPYATAEALNDEGTVVGWAQIGPGAFRGFHWRDPGPMVQLSQFAKAIDIDTAGRVLGITTSGVGAIWENGTYTNLPALPGGTVFTPVAMNDHNQIVGYGFSTTGGKMHAFVYDDGTYVDLGIAPGDDFDSLARAINNNGLIAGMSRRIGATAITSRMVIWHPTGSGQWTMEHIVDPLPGSYVFEVMDTNDAGDVVGMVGWPQVPVLWTNGTLHNLNTLLAPGQNAVFFIATAINENGWIAADGQFGCCGYILSPIVDPGPADCPADLTGNGQVNVFDLLELLSAWGPCPDPAQCPADLNGDGSVNVFDLLDLLAAWGPCP